MNANRRVMVLLTAALFIIVASLAAQDSGSQEERKYGEFMDDSRKMELTASFILQGSGANYIFLPEGRDSVNSTDNSRLTGELRFSLYFSRYKTFGLEGTLGFTHATGTFQHPSDLWDPDNPIVQPVESANHNIFHYGANLIYNFGYLDVVPFVTMGGGVNQVRPAENSSFPLDGAYYNLSLGLGFKYFINEWFGTRVEMINLFNFYSAEELDKNEHALRFQIGGVFTF